MEPSALYALTVCLHGELEEVDRVVSAKVLKRLDELLHTKDSCGVWCNWLLSHWRCRFVGSMSCWCCYCWWLL